MLHGAIGAGPKDLQKGMRAHGNVEKWRSIFTQKNVSFLLYFSMRIQISNILRHYWLQYHFGLESKVIIFIVQLPDSVEQNLEVGLRTFYHSDNSLYGKILLHCISAHSPFTDSFLSHSTFQCFNRSAPGPLPRLLCCQGCPINTQPAFAAQLIHSQCLSILSTPA